MTCSSCSSTVSAALRGVQGVVDAEADHKTNSAQVAVSSKYAALLKAPAPLIAAVSDVGFEAYPQPYDDVPA